MSSARGAFGARGRFDQVYMPHLPCFRTSARSAIGRTRLFGRVQRVYRSQHLFLAEKLIVVFLGLGVEPGIMIGLPREGTAGDAERGFVQPPDTARGIAIYP